MEVKVYKAIPGFSILPRYSLSFKPVNNLNHTIMRLKFLTVIAFSIFLTACSKKSADTPPATVPERLEITPASSSVNTGATAQFTLKFFNNTGQQATVPASVTWSSANTSIATINQQGLATGAGSGQTEIKAAYNTITATALLTVVSNNTQLASLMVMPADIQEVKLNETATLTAVGKNSTGNIINGLSFSWQSNNNSIVEINGTGTVTGKAYGTADITASSSGILSAPVMVQVIRKGNFSGSGSIGMAKLKIENGILKLQTTADFTVMTGPPDLRIYLGNNNSNINGALEVASLSQRSGVQSWNIAAPATIIQYRFVIVWCKQFGGAYGVADLGN